MMTNGYKWLFGIIATLLLGLSGMAIYEGVKHSPNLAAQFLERYPLKN